MTDQSGSLEAERFSDAELIVLARLLGADAFPGIQTEVESLTHAQGALTARNVLDVAERDERTITEPTRTSIDVVLSREATLMLGVSTGSDGASVTFFSAGSTTTRHEVLADGSHELELASRDHVLDHLQQLAEHLVDADETDHRPVCVDYDAVVEATQLAVTGDVAGASERLPEAAGYVKAVTSATLGATVSSEKRTDDGIQTDFLSFLCSPSHGLWLVDAAAGEDEDQVTLQRVSGALARERLMSLAPGATV